MVVQMSSGIAPAGSALSIIATVLFAAFGVNAWYQVARLWFNSDREGLLVRRAMNGVGRGDGDLARGFVRSLVPAGLIVVLICFSSAMLNYAEISGEFPAEWVGWTIALSIPTNIVLMVLGGSIVLSNRPRFLVAPSMRGDPGFLAVKRARRIGPEAVNQLYEDARVRWRGRR